MIPEDLTRAGIGAIIQAHRELDPGVLRSAAWLRQANLPVAVILNFNSARLKGGMPRGFPSPRPPSCAVAP